MTAQADRKPEHHERDEDHERDEVRRREDKELDKALKDSFPASDPPAIVQPTPSPEQDNKRKDERRRH